ncbi:DUF899 family protein [Amycolatopsis nigrescens]|uniref:DUF899 family protein n=1 Tax=Amycolatopsis nigrescens TaxID=381445 RepID=UPI00037B4E47|nr:DUF899 family protein [Amycolatopsis nigrescens]
MGTEWMNELKSITLHVEGGDPPMWPDGASEEYRTARRALVEAEAAVRDQLEAVAAQRRALPPGPVLPDYRFTEGPADLAADEPAGPVSLAGLFGDHDELVVYHLMFHPDDDAACPMCSMWVDGLHGVSHHLTRRAALAVVAKAPIGKLRAWGRHRGWQGLRLVSAYDTSFTTDLGVEGPRGGQFPAVSVFTRRGDQVRHSYTQSADFPDRAQRGIDLLSPVWNVWDLLPSGRGEWLPDNTYPGAGRGGSASAGG